MEIEQSSQPKMSKYSISASLLDEAVSYVKTQGGKRIISVSPVGVERLIYRLGYDVHRAGPPILIDGDMIYTCVINLE